MGSELTGARLKISPRLLAGSDGKVRDSSAIYLWVLLLKLVGIRI